MRGEINTRHAVGEREEGLDEQGLAPPPYHPGDKPPSVGGGDENRRSSAHTTGEGSANEEGEEIELQPVERRASEGASAAPPEYVDVTRSESPDSLTRPTAAMIRSERA